MLEETINQLEPKVKESNRQEFFNILNNEINVSFNWENPTKKGLLEAVRVKELGQRVGISEETIDDMLVSVAMRDSKMTSEARRRNGHSDRLVKFVDSVGTLHIRDIEAILRKDKLEENDIAQLVLFYVDAFTYAGPVTLENQNPNPEEVDDPQKSGGNYLDKVLSLKEILRATRGKITKLRDQHESVSNLYKKYKKVLHEVEEKIRTNLIAEKSDALPEYLPWTIDVWVKNRISQANEHQDPQTLEEKE